MNRYQPHVPHFAFAAGAVAMTALTLALSVVAPAHMEFEAWPARTMAAAHGVRVPVQIVAANEVPQVLLQVRNVQAKRRQAS